MNNSDEPASPSLARFIADAAPELWTVGIAGALQAGDVDPVISGLTGTAIGLALRFDRHRFQHAVGRAGYTTHLAAALVGGEQRLERLATADDHRRELTARVLLAAARTPLEQKLPALAKVLAAALDPDGRVDEAVVLAAALDDLEAPHIQLLTLIVQHEVAPVLAQYPDTGKAGWNTDQLRDALPQMRLVLPAVIQTLDRHGLVADRADRETYAGTGRARYGATDLGRRCVDLLREAAV